MTSRKKDTPAVMMNVRSAMGCRNPARPQEIRNWRGIQMQR